MKSLVSTLDAVKNVVKEKVKEVLDKNLNQQVGDGFPAVDPTFYRFSGTRGHNLLSQKRKKIKLLQANFKSFENADLLFKISPFRDVTKLNSLFLNTF